MSITARIVIAYDRSRKAKRTVGTRSEMDSEVAIDRLSISDWILPLTSRVVGRIDVIYLPRSYAMQLNHGLTGGPSEMSHSR